MIDTIVAKKRISKVQSPYELMDLTVQFAALFSLLQLPIASVLVQS